MRTYNKKIGYILFAIFSVAAAFVGRQIVVFSYGYVVGSIVFIVSLAIIGILIWSRYTGRYDRIMKKLSKPISFSWDSDDEVLENLSEIPKQEDKELSLSDMIMTNDDEKQILLTKIGGYISKGVKGKKIAFMIIALRNLGYLLDVTSDRQLFDAIRQEFGANIGTDKGIYTYLDSQTAKHHQAEIDTLTNYFSLNSFQSDSI